MLYLGIDQHARQLTISLRDGSGEVTGCTNTPQTPQEAAGASCHSNLALTSPEPHQVAIHGLALLGRDPDFQVSFPHTSPSSKLVLNNDVPNHARRGSHKWMPPQAFKQMY